MCAIGLLFLRTQLWGAQATGRSHGSVLPSIAPAGHQLTASLNGHPCDELFWTSSPKVNLQETPVPAAIWLQPQETTPSENHPPKSTYRTTRDINELFQTNAFGTVSVRPGSSRNWKLTLREVTETIKIKRRHQNSSWRPFSGQKRRENTVNPAPGPSQ